VRESSVLRTLERWPFDQRAPAFSSWGDRTRVTRTANVVLTGLARGTELRATITLSTVRPRCIDYSAAEVVVQVNGQEVRHQCIAMTDTSALTSMAHWLIEKFGAKAASINREPMPDARTAG
jgi:hypothetical protein